VATKKPWRPLYEVFLERVIRIDAVQRHRAAAVTDAEHTAQFFDAGRRPRSFADFKWSLDAPGAAGDLVLLASSMGEKPAPMSPAMQQAWDAAVAAWRKFIAELSDGEMIAHGIHPVSGIQAEIVPAEWSRTELVLDVRNGDLIEGLYGRPPGQHTVRWSAITLRAAKQPRQKKTRGHGYDWAGAWAYALTLRAEDKWDWGQLGRDKKQPLPARRKIVEEKIQQWFASSGSVPNISDIRQNITIPLYAGRRTRGKRKR
jgi:hypothetical protein